MKATNPELVQQLAQFLKNLNDGVTFTKDHLPTVIQQWMHYSIIMDWIQIWVLSGISLLLIVITARFIYLCRHAPPYEDIYEPISVISGIITLVFVIISAIAICIDISDLIMIYIAPQAWIVHSISSLIQMPH